MAIFSLCFSLFAFLLSLHVFIRAMRRDSNITALDLEDAIDDLERIRAEVEGLRASGKLDAQTVIGLERIYTITTGWIETNEEQGEQK